MSEELKQKLGSELKENEILAQHTTFKIGGPAKYFYIAKSSQDLLKAVKLAQELNINYFILGWGSNILVSDSGFDGLVIKSTSDNYKIEGDKIIVDAGFNLSKLVGVAAQAGLAGLEKFAGIPATVGGAARGNAGAFGVGLGDKIIELEIYKDGKTKKISQPEMKYNYRDSLLKHEQGIILSVVIKLEKGNSDEIKNKVNEILKERKEKLPIEPSAGCVFKNCEIDKTKIDVDNAIKELEITREEWDKATKHGKLPIGFIIDNLGLKGKSIGGAKVSEQHGSFIVNTGNAKAEHVMMLISDIKMRVRNQLGIQIQEEIQYVGF